MPTMTISIPRSDIELYEEAAAADSLQVALRPDTVDDRYSYLKVEYTLPDQLFYLGTQVQRLKSYREALRRQSGRASA